MMTALVLLLAPMAFSQTEREYKGKLTPELVVSPNGGQMEEVKPAESAHLEQLSTPLPQDAKAFYGETFVPVGEPVRFLLVEPSGRAPYLIADVNRDGSWGLDETFAFRPPTDKENVAGDVILRIPTRGSVHTSYPIRLSLPKPGESRFPGKYLLRSPFVYVEGRVNIAGQNTLVWFMYDLKKNGAYADWGWQGVDVNGDGRIATGANSEEYTFASDEGVVYRVNGRDVSPRSVDLKERTFVFREHPPGDNTRISIKPGTTLPDFEFVDLEGRARRASEFRGKYLLIDFWGSWCAPCRRELPDLQKAWMRFRSRGFEILGLPNDEDPSQTRAAIQESRVTFPQAAPESVRALIKKRFRIDAYPTLLLLDPTGSILIADGRQLRGESLVQPLDRMLPAASR